MKKALGVIPARLGSTRLPEKILRTLAGKPMIQHVWEGAKRALKLDDVIVACDDERILKCVKGFGGKVVMTRQDHPNGTSRIAEVMGHFKHDIVINIQGDQPLVDAKAIDEMVSIFENSPETEVLTLAVRMTDRVVYENPNAVKVVCDVNGDALYFSRATVPYFQGKQACAFSFLKHLGVYGYRRDFLLEFVAWNPGILESTEKLEQLRILERGRSIRVIETTYDFISVDTEEDLKEAEARLLEAPRGGRPTTSANPVRN
ncbi:MAG TPA: 3-deoxy-manno-octulosonate cytidylyltransferase [Candidatus Omnitrophota bacterium]|nr:3-deoxy-manno-octulosonate cytidylyltransferase [Candidatus Omnitrophota bacterium]HPS36120.1 3-deoxy-manno-octulosonate cytidylyltransferase [Candidatus Omnitrophota bacterium]